MLTFKSKFLQYIARQKLQQGFTLLELLITVIIVGILAAIALPNLLRQVAKGREAEAISNLGSLNRAQQAYRYENGTFGIVCHINLNTRCNHANGTLPIKLRSSSYYEYKDSAVPTATSAAYHANAMLAYDEDIKDFYGSVGLTQDGVFSAIICGTNTPNVAGVTIPTDGTTCGNNTDRVK